MPNRLFELNGAKINNWCVINVFINNPYKYFFYKILINIINIMSHLLFDRVSPFIGRTT